MNATPPALSGLKVLEIAGGAAAAYCGRLLCDAGANVSVIALNDASRLAGLDRNATHDNSGDDIGARADRRYADYLHAGKQWLPSPDNDSALLALCAQADLVIVGEASGFEASLSQPRIASIALSWFGRQAGPYRDWAGSDLVVQALSGMPQMAGRIEGPPTFFGDRQSTVVAGVTAYIAACAALLAPASSGPRRFDLSILEANIVLSEMHMHFFERDAIPMQRCGINRFSPNSPVGVYPCRDGWVGITITTPDQWRSLCKALELHAQAADEGLVTRELRFSRQDEVEAALHRALAAKTAVQWAELGRLHKVPIVVVPDAQGILDHPIFAARGSLAQLTIDGARMHVPRTPFGLHRTPVRTDLDGPNPTDTGSHSSAQWSSSAAAAGAQDAPPLSGVTVIDFAMGWAGPLASRLLGDLGATVLKIEAARYPDWWRGVNWTPEYIRDKAYENAKTFLAMNRGKRGVSVDLTTPEGRELALTLVAQADMVVENQASGVLAKLGLGYDDAVRVNPEIVMVSMSAFGTGNAWSDTRAYGSTLEQGAGVPSFMGFEGDPPTMAHLAYGDPVGGLFGCAAGLTALVGKRRTGHGQYANVSMIEAMLQFTAPALLAHQTGGAGVKRRGNRHASLVPHGIYAAQGTDQWLAISVHSAQAFAALGRAIGQSHWHEARWQSVASRRTHEDEIDAAIAAWAAQHEPRAAAARLQAAGVAAAPLLHAQELFDNAHFAAGDFYIDLQRAFSGPQRQIGVSILQNGRRLGARSPAPLLGEHSQDVLRQHAGVTDQRFEQLLATGVVSFAPAPSRNIVAPSKPL